MTKNDRHPSKYVSQEDVTTPKTWSIDSVLMEPIEGQGAEKKEKPVLYFSDRGSKSLVLNRANDEILSGAFGDDDQNWHGKKIQLFVDKNVMFAGRRVGGVRVRPLPEESVPF